MLARRKAISLKRRQDASSSLLHLLRHKGKILSFASIGTEIDTDPLNRFLASQKRLFLPRVENDILTAYPVENLDTQTFLSPYGIQEPCPILLQPAFLSDIDCILVPGLGFDAQNYRVGYGKGFYDRFLAKTNIFSIGVGFKEQLIKEFPKDPWDLPTSELLLV